MSGATDSSIRDVAPRKEIRYAPPILELAQKLRWPSARKLPPVREHYRIVLKLYGYTYSQMHMGT